MLKSYNIKTKCYNALLEALMYFYLYKFKSENIMKNLFYIAVMAVVFSACKDTAAEGVALEQQREIDSMKVVMKQQEEEAAKQKTIDSMNAIVAASEAKAAQVAAANKTAPVTAEQKKKGWSATAKGAVIGAGAGAITGAAVSKKKGEGAIIGGLAGAAVGAGTGAIIDGKKKKE